MLDPIYAKPLNSSTRCDAHLLPQAIAPGSAYIESNRDFDNRFGYRNDHHLTRLVQNQLSGEVDVNLAVFDPEDPQKQVASFNTKSTLTRTTMDGPRSGSFSIQYPKGTSDNWRDRHMALDTVLKVSIKEPMHARIALSMLHSGYLTACYHLGDEYITSSSVTRIRQLLIASTNDPLSSEVEGTALLLQAANSGLQHLLGRNGLARVIQKALELNPHPLLLVFFSGRCCLIPVLPYHPKFIALTFLPMFGETAIEEWERILLLLAQREHLKFSGCIVTPLPRKLSPAEYLRYLATSPEA